MVKIPDTSTTTKELDPCPACGQPIVATVEFRVSGIRIDRAVGTANVETVGISVSHDCRTKATDEPATPACDRDHADEWVEVDNWPDLPEGVRLRREWVRGVLYGGRRFVHRDDLPDAEPVRCGGCRDLGPHVDGCDGLTK